MAAKGGELVPRESFEVSRTRTDEPRNATRNSGEEITPQPRFQKSSNRFEVWDFRHALSSADRNQVLATRA